MADGATSLSYDDAVPAVVGVRSSLSAAEARRQEALAAFEQAFAEATLPNGTSASWVFVLEPRQDEEILTFTNRGSRAGNKDARANERILSGRANIVAGKLVSIGAKTKQRTIHAVVLMTPLSPGMVGMGRIHALASAPEEQLAEGRPMMARFLAEELKLTTILALIGENLADDTRYMGVDFVKFPKKPTDELREALSRFCYAFGFQNVCGKNPEKPPILVSRGSPALGKQKGRFSLQALSAGGSISTDLPFAKLEVHGDANITRDIEPDCCDPR